MTDKEISCVIENATCTQEHFQLGNENGKVSQHLFTSPQVKGKENKTESSEQDLANNQSSGTSIETETNTNKTNCLPRSKRLTETNPKIRPNTPVYHSYSK